MKYAVKETIVFRRSAILVSIQFWIAFAIYCGACLLYWRAFLNKQPSGYFWPQRVFELALLSNFASIIYLAIELQRIPVATIGETLLTFVVLTAGIYWILERILKNYAMGPFVLTILLALMAIGIETLKTDEPIAEVLLDVSFEIHVLTLLLSYGAFALSFIASLLHVFLDREIQKKSLGVFYSRLPSLPFFQRISNKAIDIGLAFMTMGLILGTYNAFAVWNRSFFLDPKIFAAGLTWLIYGTHFLGRRFSGWGANYMANISLIGFGWLLFSFVIISIFFSRLHDFS